MGMGIYSGLFSGLGVLLLSAIVTPVLAGNRKVAGWLNFILCTVAGGIFAAIGARVLMDASGEGSTVISLGMMNLHFLIDGFSALFMILISVMTALTSFYSIQYMEHYHDFSMRSYYINFPVFMAGMIGIVTTDDLSTGFSISWQLMTVASYFLIRFDNRDKAIIRSANKYLVLMELAWVAIVLGAWLIPGSAIGDPLHQLTEKVGLADAGLRTVVYTLLLAGFALKAGVFPLGQLWLPDAHSVAPSPISALLSGVMIKTGVYGIIRTLFWMLPAAGSGYNASPIALAVACFGVVTLFIGTIQALKQHDAKRLHAYHSIGQMGYIILGIGSALYFYYSGNAFLQVVSVVALAGAIYHTINHAVFKGLLFLCTGSVQYATGMKDLNRLGGLIKLMPVTAVVAAIAAASIAGVPAFSGFMSKWAVISSGLLAGKEAGVFALFGIVALMTSAITLASYIKFFGMTFTASGAEWNTTRKVNEVGCMMLFPKVVLAVFCIIQGLFPFVYFGIIFRVFSQSEGSIIKGLFTGTSLNESVIASASGIVLNIPGSAVATGAAMPLLLVLVFAGAYLVAWMIKRSGGGADRTTDVWLCGYQQLNDLNRYRSGGMYAAFKKLMKWTGGECHEKKN